MWRAVGGNPCGSSSFGTTALMKDILGNKERGPMPYDASCLPETAASVAIGKARCLVEKDWWHGDPSPKTWDSHCPVTALMAVEPRGAAYDMARMALDTEAIDRGFLGILSLNDHSGTTQELVLEVMDAAAARARWPLP